MSVKWLFFDLGGTIYDETLSDRQRIENLIRRNSLNFTYNGFYHQMQKAAAGYEKSPFSAARRAFGIAADEPYSNEKEILYPDALAVVRGLSEKYRLGILTNQPPNTRDRLISDGLYELLDLCLLSDCENLHKPDLRFFEYALQKAGCAPDEAVMIGDRLDNDVFPAKKAGMKTVRIAQGLFSVQRPLNDDYIADYEITRLSDLLDLDF